MHKLEISDDYASSTLNIMIFFFFFFLNFRKSGLISKGFSTSKMAYFTIIFVTFVKWDPLLRIFWPKWDPCSRNFGEKVTHLGNTSLYCEYHPPPTTTCSYVPLNDNAYFFTLSPVQATSSKAFWIVWQVFSIFCSLFARDALVWS